MSWSISAWNHNFVADFNVNRANHLDLDSSCDVLRVERSANVITALRAAFIPASGKKCQKKQNRGKKLKTKKSKKTRKKKKLLYVFFLRSLNLYIDPLITFTDPGRVKDHPCFFPLDVGPGRTRKTSCKRVDQTPDPAIFIYKRLYYDTNPLYINTASNRQFLYINTLL